MPVAIDSSVLITWEKTGGTDSFLDAHPGPFYIPAHAAAEFLLGTHPPVIGNYRERARRLYERRMRPIVDAFRETDAAQLAALIAELKATGQTMKFFDAAIAATVMARNDELWTADGDYDRLKGKIKLFSPPGLSH